MVITGQNGPVLSIGVKIVFLENYQLDETGDTRAAALYQMITDREGLDEATPMLKVRIVVRLTGTTHSAIENLPFQVAESQLVNVQVLVDHYVTNYDTLHIMNDTTRLIQAAVIPTHSILTVEIVAERIERDSDDEQRRSRFRRHNVGHQGTSWSPKEQAATAHEGNLDLFVDD